MSFFYKITYNEKERRLGVYNWGCNMRCRICTYRIKSPYRGERPIEKKRIKQVISKMFREGKVERVHFLGGEPTLNPDLEDLIGFSKTSGLRVYLGHTNGSRFIRGIDGITVSIKAMDRELHRDYTGMDNGKILENIARFYREGISIRTNTVFIPGYVDGKEIEKMAEFLSSLSSDIPFHIIGYIPVPGLPFRRPERWEMEEVEMRAKKYLRNVSWSLFRDIKEINYGSSKLRF